jgi:adenylosuccinate lyase
MWEKIKKGLRDGAALSMEKIEEYTKLGKLKVEEMAAKRKIERNFMDLGERAFDLIEEGKGSEIAQDLTVRKSIENVNALREELKELDLKMREVTESAKKEHEEEDSDISDV